MFENSISPEEPRRSVKKDAHTDAVASQHNLYSADKSTMWGKERIYYADYQQKSEVMRAQDNRITTKLDDRQTVSALLDLAESKGWDRIRIRGSDSFRRETWVQAQVRGIETTGYKPQETDLQEAARRQAAAKPVAAAAERPAATTTASPKAAKVKSNQGARQQRTQEQAVWNGVEKAGKQAREQHAQQTPGQAQAAKPVEKSAAPQPTTQVAA